MADFYVHWNTVVRKLRIHLGKCGACNDGKGMHRGRIRAGRGKTYDWVPADTYVEALEVVARLRRAHPRLMGPATVIDCGLCRPARNSN